MVPVWFLLSKTFTTSSMYCDLHSFSCLQYFQKCINVRFQVVGLATVKVQLIFLVMLLNHVKLAGISLSLSLSLIVPFL